MKEPRTGTPTGTVTFLFTDIEGSTRLWERDTQAMQGALSRHDEVLRDAIEANGGFVFKTVGDAFCAAFVTATGALEAALASQRALHTELWEEGCMIRARMALHTGVVDERGGDYFGPPVNRVARLLAAGHGGQTLLSLAAQELVRDGLPAGAALRDLGERRLKDLFRPERVFQLEAPGLPRKFPPLRTLESLRNNLPAQPTPLVGRGREVGEVCGTLRREEVRLLTLTGPGGTGKTRLALQAAADLLEEYEDGVFFVDLAAATDPDLFFTEVAGALDLREGGDMVLSDLLKEYLGRREILLILDNFEQLLGAAPLAGKLLSAAPRVKVLATSRVPLGVYGEHEYAVPPLSVPDPRRLPTVAILSQYEAVRLFVERAGAVKAGFSITNENAPAVAEICARLDGLPLAIELAASRARILAPQAMLKRLGDRLKLLTGGATDLPARQQTLRGAIDWSHDLLGEEDRTLFRRMAVFAGGRTLEAMESVCAPEGEPDVLDGVQSLVEKSLLRHEEGPEREPRFVMLETIHEFAREKLQESGEAERTKKLHAEYFLALAEEAEPELVGPDQVGWMDRLEAEHDNLRAALSWSLESGEAETALRLGGALRWFWRVRGHAREGQRRLEELLSDDTGVPDPVRAKALYAAGDIAELAGDFERAQLLLQESIALYRGTGDERGAAAPLSVLGWVAMLEGDAERARRLLEESLEVIREVGDEQELASVLHMLALASDEAGEREVAKGLFQESETLYRKCGDLQGLAGSLGMQGQVAMSQGQVGRAQALLGEGLALTQEVGDRTLFSIVQNMLGMVALHKGNTESARALVVESLKRCHELEDKPATADCLSSLGAIAGTQGDLSRAARLFGAADALREATGQAVTVHDADLYGPRVAAARSGLGEAAFRNAWEEGRAMTEEQAVTYALEEGADD